MTMTRLQLLPLVESYKLMQDILIRRQPYHYVRKTGNVMSVALAWHWIEIIHFLRSNWSRFRFWGFIWSHDAFFMYMYNFFVAKIHSCICVFAALAKIGQWVEKLRVFVSSRRQQLWTIRISVTRWRYHIHLHCYFDKCSTQNDGLFSSGMIRARVWLVLSWGFRVTTLQ